MNLKCQVRYEIRLHVDFLLTAGEQMRRLENRATRGKMEQLQLMLRERQERRKARREARASPYGPRTRNAWSPPAPLTAQVSAAHKTPSHRAMEVDANVETNVSDGVTESSGYTQITATEPVVA